MFLSASIAFLGAVMAACALVFGARRLALALAAPALWRWVILPMAQPLVLQAPPWILLAFAALLLVLLPFLAIRVLQGAVRMFYGEHAAAHVSAVYLVRLLDAIGAAFISLLLGLGRLLARLRRGRGGL